MAAATRIYVVPDRLNPKAAPRLVRATYRHRAVMHVAQDRFGDTHIAKQDELVRLISAGVLVESAADDDMPVMPIALDAIAA